MHKINGLKTIKLVILTGFLLNLQSNGPAFAISFDTQAIHPIPPNPPLTKTQLAKIHLGKKLFNDKMLSHRFNLSCASCHGLNTGGTLPIANFPTPDSRSNLNIPTIFNTKYNFRQFWDGRATTLEEAIKLVVLNPKEMSFNEEELVKRLSKNKQYAADFKTHYKGIISVDSIVNALTVYVETLNTPNSRFDQYLRGDTKALTESEKKGYALFQSYGCISCHQGFNIGGNMMQKFGIYNDYANEKKNIQDFDLGYYHVTKNPEDKFVFKVPSLRNIALTAPYLHDGSAKDLHQAVEKMAYYQIGRPIPKEDIGLIIQFLYTLTGQVDEK